MKIPKNCIPQTSAYAPDLSNIYPKSEVIVRTAVVPGAKAPMFYLDGRVFNSKDDEGREMSNAECYRSLMGFLGFVVPEMAHMMDKAKEAAQESSEQSGAGVIS